MRINSIRRGGMVLRNAVFALLLMAVAGCSDVLAVSGLSNLSGVWTGRFNSEFDFYLDLDDDLYGLYGRAGFTRTGEPTSNYIWVDGERDGGRVVFYADDYRAGDRPIFEGRVTGSDRIDGVVNFELLPEPVVLRRR
ncbi:MAG TPA: hypothetical protein VFS20_08565 [Longimicrobium sp.]|nr:hypothetical protein [Longimicrobium sp.]